MQITDIKVRKLMEDGRLRAVVSVTLGDEIAIHDLKVIEGPQRLFVAMPSRREPGGVFRDIVHPITPDARKKLEDAVLTAYTREKEKARVLSGLPYGDYWEDHFSSGGTGSGSALPAYPAASASVVPEVPSQVSERVFPAGAR